MLSDRTIKKLDKLYKKQNDYEPRLDIADKLATKTIIMVVGATCEGKSTVMDATAAIATRFCVAGTRTSREPKEGDGKRYIYYQNTDEGLEAVMDAIKDHQMVQYAVNPYSHHIYASMFEDYPSEYNLADVFSGAITSFRQAGFRQAFTATLISDPTAWVARFEARYPPGNPQRQARRDEAIESFTWSLAQQEDHCWVYNPDTQPGLAAQELIAISLGASAGQPESRELAIASLEIAKGIPA